MKFDVGQPAPRDNIRQQLEDMTAEQLIARAQERFADAKVLAPGQVETVNAGIMLEANTLALFALYRQHIESRSGSVQPDEQAPWS